jgi:hypothetical protein
MAGKVSEISPLNQQRLRTLIKTQEILNALQNHILAGTKLTTTQVRSAEILLRKVAPDLQATALSADDTLDLPILKIIKNAAA